MDNLYLTVGTGAVTRGNNNHVRYVYRTRKPFESLTVTNLLERCSQVYCTAGW